MKGDSFGRIVKVRVYATIFDKPTGLGFSVPTISYNSGYTEFSSIQPNGSPGFRIKGQIIQVQPTVSFNTNQIKLSIYNLGANSRAIIQSRVGTKITILAGYGTNPIQIGLGNILWSRTHKDGPDYITEIIAGDSQSALVNGGINLSFSGSVTYTTVINALVDALSGQGIMKGNIQGIPDGSYNQGIVLTKSPLIELADICRKLNLSFNVVGGLINILPNGSDSGNPLIEISPSTGLIGIPEVQPPGLIGFQTSTNLINVSPSNDISFTSLLRPDLVLSQRVNIVSKFITGEYIIASVTNDFDSWEGPFFSKCEAFKPALVAA